VELKPGELSRTIRLREIGSDPILIEADDKARNALALRFGIAGIGKLTAMVVLEPDGNEVAATGTLRARLTQNCAISGEPFELDVQHPLDLLFVPATTPSPDQDDAPLEVELDLDGPDLVEYEGDSFDLGEAIAQTLALLIDPYAEGPGADRARRAADIRKDGEDHGVLAALLQDLKVRK
jgi:hypothetical protein